MSHHSTSLTTTLLVTSISYQMGGRVQGRTRVLSLPQGSAPAAFWLQQVAAPSPWCSSQTCIRLLPSPLSMWVSPKKRFWSKDWSTSGLSGRWPQDIIEGKWRSETRKGRKPKKKTKQKWTKKGMFSNLIPLWTTRTESFCGTGNQCKTRLS